jgi:hypothetical protein
MVVPRFLCAHKHHLCLYYLHNRPHVFFFRSAPPQVTSCVYDELLIFNMKNLDKETFQDGLIRIAVYDANAIPFAGNVLVVGLGVV